MANVGSSRSRPTVRRALRPVLLVGQGTLLIVSLIMFYLALDLPAAPGDAWHIGARTGWECLVWGFFFWPSNALLLLSPLVALSLSRARRPIPFIITAMLYLLSTGWVLFGTSDQLAHADRLAGYVLWVSSHALVTTALLLPTWRGGKLRRDPSTAINHKR